MRAFTTEQASRVYPFADISAALRQRKRPGLRDKGKPAPRRQAEGHLPTLPCGGKQGIFRAERRKFPPHRGQSPLWKNPATAHRGGIFGAGDGGRTHTPRELVPKTSASAIPPLPRVWAASPAAFCFPLLLHGEGARGGAFRLIRIYQNRWMPAFICTILSRQKARTTSCSTQRRSSAGDPVLLRVGYNPARNILGM